MGIGHLAVGFAAKRWTPQVSVALLLLAAVFIDTLWGVAILTGVEHARLSPGATVVFPVDLYDYPITHSLLGAVGWALLFAGIFWAIARDTRAALVLAALVISHWVLDVVAHRPDMPVLPHGPYLGLGLWNSRAGSLLVEGGMLAAGLAIYLRVTRPLDRGGRYGLAGLAAFLFVVGLGAYAAPPPPDMTVDKLASTNLLILLPIGVAWLIDKHRETVASAARPG